jgi:S-DNA-T family DNA segregation ATPase FtsK/SpoIIIE
MLKQNKNTGLTATKNDRPIHPVRKEIRGIIFLLFGILLGLSLWSYHPADQLFWNVTEPLNKPLNLFGPAGAHIAGCLFFILGFSSFWLVLLLFALAGSSFRGLAITAPVTNFIATVILLVSFSAILDLQILNDLTFKGERLQFPGGLIGKLIGEQSKNLLNSFGANVFLIAVFIISLMFITNLSLARIFLRLWLWLTRIYKRLEEIVTKKKERKKRAQRSMVAREKIKSKPKVTIVNNTAQKKKLAKQEKFPFMNVIGEFELPSLDLLTDPPDKETFEIQKDSLEMNARRLEKKLMDFGVHGEVAEILPGPVITMYEYKPAPGVKISKISGLSDDLALALRAQSIRIVPNIPGKGAIGIEIPNNQKEMVFLKEILSSPEYRNSRHKLPIALGKDITGAPVITDLTKMPHLLVAGATGTGKSVCINTMINSLLFKLSPDIVRLLMIDPKRIELSAYHDIPHLLHPVVTQPKDATRALRWAVKEMERRYMLLSDRGVRNIETYNRKVLKLASPDTTAAQDSSRGTDILLPYIILIIDELADLMMVSSRDVEEAITRLAQMARAAGMHLVIATQRPSVDVLTGIIKANFPTRISFQVSSKVDSRTILDSMGAENLLGAGDMLFMPPGVAHVQRIHGAFISEEEVADVTSFIRSQKKPEYDTKIISEIARDEKTEHEELERDKKYDEAVELVTRTRQASISMLQRKLRVGYNRAARMIEAMENDGLVGPSDGVKPREVYSRDGGGI